MVMSELMTIQQNEALPAVFFTTISSLLSELHKDNQPGKGFEIGLAYNGLNPIYKRSRENFHSGGYDTLADFQVAVEQEHRILIECGEITDDYKKTATPTHRERPPGDRGTGKSNRRSKVKKRDPANKYKY